MDWGNIFNGSLVYATWRSATPVIYAALAAVITQQANILNIGTEGTMLMGAFTAVAVSYTTGSWLLGVLVAMLAGLLMAGIMAVGSIRYKADINAIGIGINMLSLAVTKFLLNVVVGAQGTFSDPAIKPIPRVNIPFLAKVPLLDTIFNGWALTEWLVIVLIIAMTYGLYRTRWGLRLRAVGFNEQAPFSLGINTDKIKYQAMLISGLIGGLAGAHLSLGYSRLFTENMTNNRGFVAVAAMFFGGANPLLTTVGTLIFGFTDSVGGRLQAYGFPSQIILAMPYIAKIVILSISMINKKRLDKQRKTSLS